MSFNVSINLGGLGGMVQGGFPGQAPPVDPQLWAWFSAVDRDRSGSISWKELQAALGNGSFEPFNDNTVRMMIALFDQDHSGTINFQEFTGLWNYINEWKRVFDGYDRDRSRSIDANELGNALRQFGYTLSPQFINLVVFKYDRSGARTLSFDDFIQVCILLTNLTNSFKRYDTQRNGWANMQYEQFLTESFRNLPT